MTRLIIDKRGVEMSYETECLIIRGAEGDYRSVPLSRISQVICLHSVQLTTQLLGQLLAHGIDFILMNNRYPEHGFELFANHQQQVARRCLQYEWQISNEISLVIAKAIVAHKFRTFAKCSGLLVRHNRAEHLRYIQAITGAEGLDQLRGVEGSLQRMAFDYWKQSIPDEFSFTKRIRRPPPDPVNALLSLTYTLVFHEAVRQCKRFGLDPALGFYHRASFGRASLACDLMEPSRPIVEGFVVQLLQEKKLNKRHFSYSSDIGCRLGKEGRLVFYENYNEFMQINKRRIEAPARWLTRKLNKSLSSS